MGGVPVGYHSPYSSLFFMLFILFSCFLDVYSEVTHRYIPRVCTWGASFFCLACILRKGRPCVRFSLYARFVSAPVGAAPFSLSEASTFRSDAAERQDCDLQVS